MSEHVISAQNSIFVACATVRTLENAARAAELLEKDKTKIKHWRELAAELRQNLPKDEKQKIYHYADDTNIPTETAHLAMVYPFAIDIHSEYVKNTTKDAWRIYQENKQEATSEKVSSYNWIWALGRLATICFYQGLADKGYEALNQTPRAVGPFMAPNEHYRREGGAFLPWFATGSGAYVYAMNAMFVQVLDERGAIIFPALPSSLKNARFDRLLANHNVAVSGEVRNGKIVDLTAFSQRPISWSFRMPEKLAKNTEFADDLSLSTTDADGLITIYCKLQKGVTRLVK